LLPVLASAVNAPGHISGNRPGLFGNAAIAKRYGCLKN